MVTTLNPHGDFFGHDKIEGVAAINGGRTLVISNDNDFGISGLTTSTPPFQLKPKTLPNGTQDDGEYLAVNLTKIHNTAVSSTVTVLVIPGPK